MEEYNVFTAIIKKIKSFFRNIFKKKINVTYDAIEGKFSIKGTEEKFNIIKNNKFEFLVVNGEIVAFRDLSKNEINYTYYKKEG